MSVRLLNVKFSPNVGDGLFVLCMEERLRRSTSDVSSIDLAGRTGYRSHDGRRELSMRILASMPPVVRPRIARAGLDAKLAFGLRRHYRDAIAGIGSLVLGGGNLLSDQDLNFPVKIAAALEEADRARARLAIHGCGVSSRWSRSGREMLCAAFAANPPVHVAVRDRASKQAWDTFFASAAGREAVVVNDPGVLASTLYRFDDPRPRPDRPVVAVGLMSDFAVRYHGFASLSAQGLAGWYLALIAELTARGFEVCVFTNGSPEDRRFAKDLWASLAGRRRPVHVRLADVALPVDLCRVVAGAGAVIAFRMHALIAAYSYGKPLVALKWDPKVEAFLDAVGLAGDQVDVVVSSPSDAVGILASVVDRGVDHARRRDVLSRAGSEIEELAAALSRSP